MRGLVAGVIGIVLSGLPVRAHTVWANGDKVPDWVRSSCCGAADAHLLDPDDFWIDPSGFHIREIDMVVPIDRVQPSMDGRVWAFYNPSLGRGATVYCVFYAGSI